MSWVITPRQVDAADPDARAYLAAVEAADTQALEPAVRLAVDAFVVGCKADGIWTAIKASCILAGARTLAGALVPLVGAAPTNVNFVSGDYNRKTGLAGNGSNKYLDTNRLHSADPQNNAHLSIFASTAATSAVGQYPNYIGAGSGPTGTHSTFERIENNGALSIRLNVIGSSSLTVANATGFIGASRAVSNEFIYRGQSANSVATIASAAPATLKIAVFAKRNASGVIVDYANARLAFYSIGESLNLALLDARVTTLINAFAAAIP